MVYLFAWHSGKQQKAQSMGTVAQTYRLISFTGQDKHFDEALAKAQQKANEWLAASDIESVAISTTTAVAPNGKFVWCNAGLSFAPVSNFERARAGDRLIDKQ